LTGSAEPIEKGAGSLRRLFCFFHSPWPLYAGHLYGERVMDGPDKPGHDSLD
jgi:hypothetical protein